MATLAPFYNQQFFTDAGAPVALGYLYTYASGTTTDKATYQDQAQSTPNTNPIALDAAGRIPVAMWLGTGEYTFVLKTNAGATIKTWDDIGGIASIPDLSASSGSSLVGFIQSGAGAVARTAQSKFRDLLSITDFGAVNGQNATVAINAAIAAATTDNKSVFFPAGTWYIDATIVWSRGVNWYGEGVEATRIDAQSFPSASGDPMVSLSSCPSWEIHGIRFEGANKASGIYALNSYWGRMVNCHVNGIKGNGVWLDESAGTVLDQVSMYYFVASTDVGVYVDGGSQTILKNCYLNTNAVGVKADTATVSGLICLGTMFEGNITAIHWPLGQNPLHVLNCFFEGITNTQGTILCGTTGSGDKPDVVFRGNIIAATLTSDISFAYANSVVWEDNTSGRNVTFTNGVDNLYIYGANRFAAGKAFTISAQIFTQSFGAITKHGTHGADSRTFETHDATLGSWLIAYDEAETGYSPITEDGTSWEWRANGSTSNKASLSSTGDFTTWSRIYPGTDGGARQSAAGIFAGTGVPNNANGSNGDFYFRSDGGAGSCIYQRRGGTWVATGA